MKIEVTKKSGSKPRWTLRDSRTGQIIPLKLGRVRLPPTVSQNRKVRDAVDNVLSEMAVPAGRTEG